MTINLLVVPDERFWFAQALEFDYGAQGNTAVEAIQHCREGLVGTLQLRAGRGLDILPPTPIDVVVDLRNTPGRIAETIWI